MTHVTTHRGDRINAAEVCTGETWLALHAQPLGLVDGVMTSDECGWPTTEFREGRTVIVPSPALCPRVLAPSNEVPTWYPLGTHLAPVARQTYASGVPRPMSICYDPSPSDASVA